MLKITEGVEKGYQAIMALKQKDAATIRSQLFLLSGSPSISFEKALEYANLVWKILKVRPAFLLGVIREESNLGANVGKGNWKEDLSHSKCAKQREAFVQITSELGLDPDLLPVSKKPGMVIAAGLWGRPSLCPPHGFYIRRAFPMLPATIRPIRGNPKTLLWRPACF